MKRLGVGRALVAGQWVDGDVGIEDDRVVAVGLPGGGSALAVPGFVDLQVNGFGGVDLLADGPEGLVDVCVALPATGVVAFQPTYITAAPEALKAALRGLSTALADGPPGARVLGAHLEGPYLSPARAGTHPVDRLTAPDAERVRLLRDIAPVTQVTLAPELPGALEFIAELAAEGVLVAVGHTAADATITEAAFDAGATIVTHLFNAMPPLLHRDPGPVGAALADDSTFVCLIADGIHLDDRIVRLVFNAAPGRTVLTTDAVAAAGRPDGPAMLGEVAIVKEGLEVRRASDGTLAGSALTMDAAVRRAVDAGIPLEQALHAAARAPADALGRHDLGDIRIGGRADIAVLGPDLFVQRTHVAGRTFEP